MPDISSSNNTNNDNHSPIRQLLPSKKLTVRQQNDERRKKKDEIAKQSLVLAETSITDAMKFIQNELPYEFLQRSDKFVI